MCEAESKTNGPTYVRRDAPNMYRKTEYASSFAGNSGSYSSYQGNRGGRY